MLKATICAADPRVMTYKALATAPLTLGRRRTFPKPNLSFNTTFTAEPARDPCQDPVNVMVCLKMKHFLAHDAIRYEDKGDNGKANLKRPILIIVLHQPI